jgi:membrane-associated phospholipid phosphatase
MIHLHFNLQLVEFFVDHRTPALTHLFAFASFFGSSGFYIILTMLLYFAWDKRQAIRLSVLILLTMSFNDILKLFIKNPRPFMTQGTYRQKWAVSPANANALAAEYSTPSGHAMGSSAFYSYLFAVVRNRYVRALLVLTIVLIGASRPYLGVHYVEDVLLGWLIGLLLAIAAIRYATPLAGIWARIPYGGQIVIAVAASIALWLLALVLNGRIDDQVRELTAYSGFLTGIVIGFPLEIRTTNFDPRSGGAIARILRYTVSLGVMACVLFALKLTFRPLAAGATTLGCALEYIRYVAAEIAAIFLAPVVFCKMNLAGSQPAAAAD